ncbi:MAG: glycosyltransferase family 4 protein [SAR324 cluster bacterium]|nr:glycosyltransferase family 4 protein [SAR324 cluster bacterium]
MERSKNASERTRILINGISARQGGGQTYLLNLLKFIPEKLPVDVTLLVPDSFPLPKLSSNIRKHSIPRVESNPFFRAIWEKLFLPGLLRQWEIDVLFCPGGVISTVPPKNCKTVTMFQNMLPFAPEERKRYPFGYMRFRLWLLKFLQERSFQNADMVIFISHHAKTVIDHYLPQRKGSSPVIPHGLSEHFKVRKERPFPPEMPSDYVLYVSILDVYKAQLEVVKAWHMLRLKRSTREKLVLLGPSFPPYEKKLKNLIHSLRLESEILLVGAVPYQELPNYYQHAKINIFASSCENCPNIVLEKLASGRPVFLSNYPPMPEFGTNAVEYFDPYTPQQLTELLLKYLDKPSLGAALSQKSVKQADKFHWQESAEKTWHALLQLAVK